MKKSLLTLALEFSGLEERFMRQPKLRLGKRRTSYGKNQT